MKKKHKLLSLSQLLPACFFLLVFAGITVFLFTYQRDEKLYTSFTSRLFREEMLASTLNMHYTLAYPENFGICDYRVQLPCYSKQEELYSQAAAENALASLRQIRVSRLSETDAYSYTLLKRYLENSLQRSGFSYFEEPLSPSSGMQSQLPILLAEYTFRSRQDVEDYLKLLEQTGVYFDSLLCYEQEKAAAGLLMSSVSLKKVVSQCDTIVTDEALEEGAHFLQTTFQERLQLLCDAGKITVKEARSYLAQNDRLLKTVVRPAYEALGDGLLVLEDSAITPHGLAAKPQGADYYQYLFCSETGSYRSIPETKDLLLQAFRREYEAIQSLLSSNSALENPADAAAPFFPLDSADDMLRDLQYRMRTDFPSLPAPSGESALPDGSAPSEDFSLSGGSAPSGDFSLPGVPAPSGEFSPSVTVKAVSPSLEKYCAPAFYLTAPVDDTDSNVIYINEKNSPVGLELYTTLAHEGYPGHLYQTVYSNRTFLQENENPVRNILWYGGYLEGWALYVEFESYDYATALLEEAGYSADALDAQIEKHNRSLQLCLYSLLDIMIHYENVPYSKVEEILTNFGISNPDSIHAVYTYIAEEPCNYLKYYLGYLEILSLQEQAKTAWGDHYTDYAFHKFYLDCGPSDFLSLEEQLESYSSIMDSK